MDINRTYCEVCKRDKVGKSKCCHECFLRVIGGLPSSKLSEDKWI